MRFDVKALAVTCSLLWGLTVFLLTWWVIFLDGATGESTVMARVYRGYSITPWGSLIGLVWGLVDGLIGGAIFGWTYNFVASRISKKTPVVY